MMTEQEALFKYILRLGDNGLILGQRLGEWCGHGPALEEDIALTNIALDILGQSNTYLQLAARLEAKGRNEDQLAMLRLEHEYTNVLLVEQPNGHFGDTIARQFLFDTFNYFLTEALTNSTNNEIQALASKGLKEITYHVRHSREWILRLGDGTEESHEKIQTSINNLWKYTGELFVADDAEKLMADAGIGANLDKVKEQWNSVVSNTLSEATLKMPKDDWMMSGGKNGVHSEHMGYILSELQYMQRTFPNLEW